MSNRQKIYIGLAISAGVCTGVGLFIYFRYRRQNTFSKSSLLSRRGDQYTDITSSTFESDQADKERVRFQSRGATIEVDIPGGAGTTLTADQAIVLTRFLDETDNDIERLNRILTNIANAATFQENQANLTNAGCIERLREILLTTENETTKCKILLALNNLALNEQSITHFTDVVPLVINLCRTSPSESLVRLYGLKLLINMSVLENLHDEYMQNIYELGLLIASTFSNQEEALAAGKILVNLSTNKSNIEYLLKLSGIEVKTIVKFFTPPKTTIDSEEIEKFDDILLRYLTFYCNLAETIVKELQQDKGDSNKHRIYLNDPIPYRENAIYFELFDHEKQMVAKTLLRPQHASSLVNLQIKRFRQALDTIRQVQFESSISSANDEFNQHDQFTPSIETSTPKKSIILPEENNLENQMKDIEKEVNDEFKDDEDDDDETILAEGLTPSNQSLASFQSAVSQIDNNTFTSPENSTSSENN